MTNTSMWTTVNLQRGTKIFQFSGKHCQDRNDRKRWSSGLTITKEITIQLRMIRRPDGRQKQHNSREKCLSMSSALGRVVASTTNHLKILKNFNLPHCAVWKKKMQSYCFRADWKQISVKQTEKTACRLVTTTCPWKAPTAAAREAPRRKCTVAITASTWRTARTTWSGTWSPCTSNVKRPSSAAKWFSKTKWVHLLFPLFRQLVLKLLASLLFKTRKCFSLTLEYLVFFGFFFCFFSFLVKAHESVFCRRRWETTSWVATETGTTAGSAAATSAGRPCWSDTSPCTAGRRTTFVPCAATPPVTRATWTGTSEDTSPSTH